MLGGQSGEPWSHRFYQFSQTTFSIKSIIIGGVEQNEIVENCKRLAIGFVSLSERKLQITMVFPRWSVSISPLILSSSFHNNRPLMARNERTLYFRLMTRDYDEAWMLPGHVREYWLHQHRIYSSLALKWQQRNPAELPSSVVIREMLSLATSSQLRQRPSHNNVLGLRKY